MPVKKQDQVLVACPHCGHKQAEPRTAISTLCRKCGRHLELEQILRPTHKAAAPAPRQQHITCFECGAGLAVPVSAESTMCKWCSSYVDLHDYRIISAVAKNFRTKGLLVIDPKGYVFNTETLVGEAVIRGKFHGKLAVERSLTVYSTAEIKGNLTTGQLVIPADNCFRWPDTLQIGSAEIAGEFSGRLSARNGVVLKATARVFGDVEAKNLVVEAGAVVVGKLWVGQSPNGQQKLFA